MNYTTYSGMLNSVVFPCVGYVVTGIAVLMTPTIADAIVSAGGAGVMTKAHKDAAKMASASAKAVSAPISAAKSAANAAKTSVAQTTLSAVTGGLNNMPYTSIK